MKRIVITGFMGCGKTKLARKLARHLNVIMVDLDERITQRTGRSPAQVIVEDGEAAFRAIESDTLRHLLESDEATVIALGGGAWIEEANRRLIDQYGFLSIWLDTPFERCWDRIQASEEDRPLGRSRSMALALYERRRPIYQLANIHIREEVGEDVISLVRLHLSL